MQWAAIGLGTLAVVVLAVDYGRPPWIALTLAFSFGTYGLLKKQVGATVGAVQSLTVETAVLFVPALTYLVVLDARGDAQLGHSGLGHGLLLASAGIATAVPLLFFASAARRIPLSTLGLLQYIAPVLQFLIGRPAVRRADAGLAVGRVRARLGRAGGPDLRRPATGSPDPPGRPRAGSPWSRFRDPDAPRGRASG